MTVISELSWPKRATIETNIFRRRSWRSHCGRYKVVHSQFVYSTELVPVWYAMVYDREDEMWDIVSKHRKREPAFKACESHARNH